MEMVFVDAFRTAFVANKQFADKAIAQLSEEQLRQSLDPNVNSIAVVMKHVAGNLLSRFADFLTTDGEKPDRNRDDEFVDTFGSRDDMIAYWEKGWACLFQTLDALGPEDVANTVTIRGEPHTVPLALARSLGHCGYHVGQIVQTARIVAGEKWETITIPRGGSAEYNQRFWDKGHYSPDAESNR